MSERRVLVKVFAGPYQAGCKKDRSRLLDEFVAASGYNRPYASWLLRWHGKQVGLGLRVVLVGDATTRWRRRRRRVYGEAVRSARRWLWEVMDYVCGKRLVAGLPAVIEALERHGAGRWDATLRSQLLSLSAATADLEVIGLDLTVRGFTGSRHPEIGKEILGEDMTQQQKVIKVKFGLLELAGVSDELCKGGFGAVSQPLTPMVRTWH